MGETWRKIPGHKGYEASSYANVRSVARTLASGRRVGGKVLKRQLDKDGYPTVKLAGKRVRVSVIVQLAFAGPPEVLHLDDDRENCRPSNLRWGSRVENEQMKRTRGREEEDGRGCYRPSPPVTPVTGDLQR